MKDYVDSAKLQEYTTKLVTKLKTIFPGTPTAVLTAAEMTDHSKVYVYAGTETGYTAGDWYYWDGSAWASGGVYNAEAIVTDTTLSVPGMAADAEVTGEEIADLKTQLDDLDEFCRKEIVTVTSGSISATQNTTITKATHLVDVSIANGTDFKFSLNATGIISGAFALYANGNSLNSNCSVGTEYTFTATENIEYISIYCGKSNVIADGTVTGVVTITEETENSLEERIDEIDDEIAPLPIMQDQIDHAVKKIVTDTVASIVKAKNSVTAGSYVNKDGSTHELSWMFNTNIQVLPGEVVSVREYYINSLTGNIVYNTNLSNTYLHAVCAFDGETIVADAGKDFNYNSEGYTVPEGIDNITISFGSGGGTYQYFEILRTIPNGTTTYYVQERMVGNPLRYEGGLASNEVVSLGYENVTTNKIWVFDGKINTFGITKIGSCNAAGEIVRPYVEVTGSSVNIYSDIESNDRSYDHGLTIENDLQIIVQQGRSMYNEKLIVQSNGYRWVCENNRLRIGNPYNGIGAATSGSFSDCSVSVSMMDINRPTWVFGDSWIVLYETRWPTQAVALGFDKWLLSGHAGETSVEAVKSLKTLVQIKQPKTLIWCMGMNDADTDDSTPNADWLSALEEVEDICELYNITLILYTVPTVPATQGTTTDTPRNNNAKNAYIKASGYRYVDCAAAMGANTDGQWFDGYWQSDTDHTHTSERGAKALMARFFADAPELLET